MQETARLKIGTFLRLHREAVGLNPAEAARHLNLADAAEILRIEAGVQSVTVGDIYAFANIYNAPTTEVLALLLEVPHLESSSAVDEAPIRKNQVN